MGDGERFEDAVEHQNGSTSRNQRSEEKQKYKKPTFDVKDLVNAGSSTTAPVGGSRGSSANGHSDEPLDNHDSGSEDKEAGAQTDKSRPSVRDWFNIGNRDFNAKGLVSKSDGRLHLSVNETANRGYFAKALGASLHSHLGSSKQDVKPPQQKQRDEEVESIVSRTAAETAERPIPRLNIVVMVVGSRGDIQPFIRVSKILRDEYGHRVRVATHPAFKDFVEKDCGLEFFSIGGDPAELMAFMVKNPGLVPSFDTIRKGEIGRRRQQMSEMFAGFWRSCIEESDGETHNEGFEPRPFVADAIISNPPVMIHIHCAERLGCPLHIMFTFPYTPTQAFPHPLANIEAGNVDESYTNFMSYPLVELMTWSGLGDLVNDCRINILQLDQVSTIWAPGQLYRQRVPYTYLWSPALCPKPADWGEEISIAGFVFLELASDFKPPQDLEDFLNAGKRPIYIGFGSIVVDDPDAFTKLVFEASKKAGVRAVVNKGWGGMGGGSDIPDHVFLINNIPHDWLFPRCSAVVHHGGAGTTAIGLKFAKPTVIVPFFGDQPFWGSICASARAGAHECIPYKELDSDRLAKSIRQCFAEESQRSVQRIADQISNEGDGAHNAVKYFHASLPLRGTQSLRGSVLEEQAAVWRMNKSSFRLSGMAAEMMVQDKKLSYDDLRLLRVYPWSDFQGPGAPLTGLSTAAFRTVTGLGKGVAAGPLLVAQDVKKEVKHERRHKREGRIASRSASQFTGSGGQSEPVEKKQSISSARQEEGRGASLKDITKHGASVIMQPMTVIARAPMEILLGIGYGFHNAPRLYGDQTVRRPQRITGLKSGMRAAGNEFAFQSYDAITGLATQPYHETKARGAKGAAIGAGKGFGGLVLKGSSAAITPFGIAMKGVDKEATRSSSPVGKIREARISQGQRQVADLSNEQRAHVSQNLNEGLAIMHQLWEEGEKLKGSGVGGLSGRIKYRRERKKWVEFGALESAEMSKKAMEARKRGIPFDHFLRDHQQDVKKSEEQVGGKGKNHDKRGWWGARVPDRSKKEATTEGGTA